MSIEKIIFIIFCVAGFVVFAGFIVYLNLRNNKKNTKQNNRFLVHLNDDCGDGYGNFDLHKPLGLISFDQLQNDICQNKTSDNHKNSQ